MSTLTYVYEDSTAVLGPLSRSSEPHAYDLCADHGRRLTAPRGWRLLHVPGGGDVPDDLVALSDAVHASAHEAPAREAAHRTGTGPASAGRHLHVVRSTHE